MVTETFINIQEMQHFDGIQIIGTHRCMKLNKIRKQLNKKK